MVEQANVFRRVNEKIEFTPICKALLAMANPVRLTIVLGLLKKLHMYRNNLIDDPSANVKEIWDGLGMYHSQISYHLKLLRKNKIVKGRKYEKCKREVKYSLCSNIDFLEFLFKSLGVDLENL